jgi:hypothetical protein
VRVGARDFRAALATLRAGFPGQSASLPDSAAPPHAWTGAKSPTAATGASAADLPDPVATPAAPAALAPAPQAIAPKLDNGATTQKP